MERVKPQVILHLSNFGTVHTRSCHLNWTSPFFTQAQARPLVFGAYPHTIHTRVDAAPAKPPLQCRPVSHTPIYDQLRGERINADVPAPAIEAPQVVRPEQDHPPADVTSAAAVFARPPGPEI